jgi:penicillin V acylase-like amidase (Ntn superfamily)
VKRTIAVLFLGFLLSARIGRAECTSFRLVRGDTVVFGNTLDWYFEDGIVFINKRNVSKTALWFQNPARWTSKYGSITFNQWGREFPQRGMNEAGLVVGEMTLSETRYPDPDGRGGLSNPQWIQWQLDNCATVGEVIESDGKIRIDRNEYPSHFLVADAAGNCAALEWLDGRLIARTGEALPIAALTNSTYESSVAFYREGKPHAPDDYCTWARFFRAADLLAAADTASGTLLDHGWKIHAAVDHSSRTRWALLFDVRGRRAYFRTESRPEVRFADLMSFDLSCDAPVRMLAVSAALSGDVTRHFMDYDSALNHALIRRMAAAHGPITGATSESAIRAMARYPETTVCGASSSAEPGPEGRAIRTALRPNHPNPFNPSTRIRYSLERTETVRLTVLDLAGRRVRTLTERVQPAGDHETVWDGSDERGCPLASGVYLAKLDSGGRGFLGKMLLVR